MSPHLETAHHESGVRLFIAVLPVYVLFVLCAPQASAQAAGAAHWSIYGGRTVSSAEGADQSFSFPSENFGVGGSLELKPSFFPLPLRTTLSYDKFRAGPSTTLKATSLKVDAVFRPVPEIFGIRAYLLGGLGIATVSPSGVQVLEGGAPRVIPIARTTALELNAGLGLECRRLFVEYGHSPYGILGDPMPTRAALRLGIKL